jgi:hypothetical protein
MVKECDIWYIRFGLDFGQKVSWTKILKWIKYFGFKIDNPNYLIINKISIWPWGLSMEKYMFGT